ncbi:MAG: Na-translocating system protein MpsC family protein [Tepidibacillus sp.]
MKRKGELEAEISALYSKGYKTLIGRGPKNVKTRICEDMLIIRVCKYHEPIVEILKTQKDGIDLFVRMNRAIYEGTEKYLADMVTEILGFRPKKSFYDEYWEESEIVIFLLFEENIEQKLHELGVI